MITNLRSVRTRLLPFSLFMALNASLIACGGDTKTTKIKDYRLAVVADDEAMKLEFKQLIQDFNGFAGASVLTYVDDAADANSAIVVTKGLRARDGKVGWGQWLSETENDGNFLVGGKRRVSYSMRLEFDEEYLRKRMAKDETSAMRYEKQKLFFHEVGHGLQLDHDGDPASLMYFDISGDKDFESFFDYVRSFMSDFG